jgi:hypothetical protein
VLSLFRWRARRDSNADTRSLVRRLRREVEANVLGRGRPALSDEYLAAFARLYLTLASEGRGVRRRVAAKLQLSEFQVRDHLASGTARRIGAHLNSSCDVSPLPQVLLSACAYSLLVYSARRGPGMASRRPWAPGARRPRLRAEASG